MSKGSAAAIRNYLESLKQGSTLDVRDYVEKNNLTGNEKFNAAQNIRRLLPEFSNKKLKVIEIEDTFDTDTQKKILTPRDKRRIKKWEKRTGLKYTDQDAQHQYEIRENPEAGIMETERKKIKALEETPKVKARIEEYERTSLRKYKDQQSGVQKKIREGKAKNTMPIDHPTRLKNIEDYIEKFKKEEGELPTKADINKHLKKIDQHNAKVVTYFLKKKKMKLPSGQGAGQVAKDVRTLLKNKEILETLDDGKFPTDAQIKKVLKVDPTIAESRAVDLANSLSNNKRIGFLKVSAQYKKLADDHIEKKGGGMFKRAGKTSRRYYEKAFSKLMDLPTNVTKLRGDILTKIFSFIPELKGKIAVDEIGSLTSGMRRGSGPYSIFGQVLGSDFNSLVKGRGVDRDKGFLEKKLTKKFLKGDPQRLVEQKKYNQKITDFEIEANKDNPIKKVKGLKLSFKHPSKTIKNKEVYNKYKDLFDAHYEKHGYSFEVPADRDALPEILTKLDNKSFQKVLKNRFYKLAGKGGKVGILAGLATLAGTGWALTDTPDTVDQVSGTVDQVSEVEADETGITDQSMEYNSTTGEFVNTETGDPETQTGILNWIADNPGKSGFLGLPVMLGLGQAVGGMRTAPGRYLTSWTAAIPAMMIPEKMWQYKQGMEAGEMITDPFNALFALGIENKASLAAAEKWYNSLPEGQRTRLMSMQNLKDLKTTQGWKNLPKGLRNAILSPAASGTDWAFQKRLKPVTKKLTQAIIGSPFAKETAKKGLGALAKRAAIGIGATAVLGTTVAGGLMSAPLTLLLLGGAGIYGQIKDYRDGKKIVDSMLARGKITQKDADGYMDLIFQGSLPFGLGNRLIGADEMTLRGQTLDPTQQRAVLKGMEDQIDIFQDQRKEVRALDRADDFDFFNEGGRVGMKTGGMDRRGFLKWLMGLAGTVGAGGSGLFKQGWKAPTKQVAETVAKETLTTTQPEMWVPRLIAKIKAEGKLLEMADKKYVNGDIYEHTINGKKITMESNPVTGTTEISWSAPDYDSEMTRSIQFDEGEIITQGKLAGQKTQPEVMFTEPDRSTPYRDDFSDFDPVTDADETLTSMQKWIGVEDAKTTGPKTSNYDFEEGGYEEFNTGGRIGYADQGLVGTPTDEVTQYDRRVYTTPTGEEVSEKSVTIPMGGMWINIPSIHDGRAYTEDQLTEMILRGEIEPTSVHEDREEAIMVATQRSDMMKRHKKGFNTGGEVETGAIARRQSLVPPLAGPNPQGIMGLPSDVKQVRVG